MQVGGQCSQNMESGIFSSDISGNIDTQINENIGTIGQAYYHHSGDPVKFPYNWYGVGGIGDNMTSDIIDTASGIFTLACTTGVPPTSGNVERSTR